MFCRRCRYDLSHTNDHRCPECGGAFNPDDPNTTLPRGDRGTWLRYQTGRYLAGMRERRHGDGGMFCKACYTDLRSVHDDHCPTCRRWFRCKDPDSYYHSDHALNRIVNRFRHVCIWRGVLAPLIPLWIGLEAIITQSTRLPGGGRAGISNFHTELLRIEGAEAVAMGLAWLGVALILHSRYFWGFVENAWRYVGLPQIIGAVMLFGGWGYALVRSINATLLS
jgi:hypothetical protein